MHIPKVARILQLEKCRMGRYKMEPVRKDSIKTDHFINAKMARHSIDEIGTIDKFEATQRTMTFD